MEEALTNTWTAPIMLETGKKINNMDTALRHGQMLPSTKVTMNMERNTASVLSNGLMAQLISESSIITIFMVKEFTHGPITENTRENGGQIKCMAKVPLPGLTIVSTSVSMPKTRKRGTASSSGQMVGATVVSGSMESNMEKELTSQARVSKSMENGKKVKESDG